MGVMERIFSLPTRAKAEVLTVLTGIGTIIGSPIGFLVTGIRCRLAAEDAASQQVPFTNTEETYNKWSSIFSEKISACGTYDGWGYGAACGAVATGLFILTSYGIVKWKSRNKLNVESTNSNSTEMNTTVVSVKPEDIVVGGSNLHIKLLPPPILIAPSAPPRPPSPA